MLTTWTNTIEFDLDFAINSLQIANKLNLKQSPKFGSKGFVARNKHDSVVRNLRNSKLIALYKLEYSTAGHYTQCVRGPSDKRASTSGKFRETMLLKFAYFQMRV